MGAASVHRRCQTAGRPTLFQRTTSRLEVTRLYHRLDCSQECPYLASIGSEMSQEWIDIVPAQRRAAGESAYKSWLAVHGLSEANVARDVMLEIGRMVGGGDFVRYAMRASRLAELGLTPEADIGRQ